MWHPWNVEQNQNIWLINLKYNEDGFEKVFYDTRLFPLYYIGILQFPNNIKLDESYCLNLSLGSNGIYKVSSYS